MQINYADFLKRHFLQKLYENFTLTRIQLKHENTFLKSSIAKLRVLYGDFHFMIHMIWNMSSLHACKICIRAVSNRSDH
jgi:hypothetical protein